MPDSVIQFTRPVTKRLASLEEVEGILCFGSSVLGTDDNFSDIDLYILYKDKKPSQSARRQVLGNRVSGYRFADLSDNWATEWIEVGEQFEFGEKTFDVGYKSFEWVESVVHKVKQVGCTSTAEMPFRAHTLLGLLDSSIIMFDRKGNIKTLLESLYPYPTKLKQSLIKDNTTLLLESLEELELFAQRNTGNTAFLFHLMRALDAIAGLLFATNERYDPATKHVEFVLSKLKVLPSNFETRYTNLLVGPFTEEGKIKTTASLRDLADDIIGLSSVVA